MRSRWSSTTRKRRRCAGYPPRPPPPSPNSCTWRTLTRAAHQAIGFQQQAGADGGYTEAGTWLSYNNPKSVSAICAYAKKMGVGGAFAFDTR